MEFLKEWSSLILLGIVISTTLVGYFSGAFKAIWKISAWKQTVDSKLESLESKVEGLDIRLTRVEKRLDELFKLFTEFLFNRQEITKSTSPLTLTDYGKELSEKVNAGEIVEQFADYLFKKVKGRNEYQIQEICFEFAKLELLEKLKANDPQEFEEISKIAFNEGIELSKVTRVIGLELRDRMFEMRG